MFGGGAYSYGNCILESDLHLHVVIISTWYHIHLQLICSDIKETKLSESLMVFVVI